MKNEEKETTIKEVIFVFEDEEYNTIFSQIIKEFSTEKIKFNTINNISLLLKQMQDKNKINIEEEKNTLIFLTNSQLNFISGIYEKKIKETGISLREDNKNYHIKVISNSLQKDYYTEKIKDFLIFDKNSKEKIKNFVGCREPIDKNIENSLHESFDTAVNNDFHFETEKIQKSQLSLHILSDDIIEKIDCEYYRKQKSDVLNRYLLIIIFLFVIYGITSFKGQIQKNLNISIACDISSNWTEINHFKKKIHNTTYKQLEDCIRDCDNWNNYIYSKIFHLNFYILYCMNCFYCLKYCGVLKYSKIVFFFFITWSLIANLLADAIFFKNLRLSHLAANLFSCLPIIIFFIRKKLNSKMLTSLGIALLFISIVKYFFEEIYFYVDGLLFSHEFIEKYFLTFFCKFLQYVFVLFTKIGIVEVPNEFLKFMVCLIINGIFEFISIGNKHNIIINHGIFSLEFFISLSISFLFDLDKKILILKTLIYWMKNCFKKVKEEFKLNNFEQILIGNKLLLQIFTIGIYFILINNQFYEFSNLHLVDCKSVPIKELYPVLSEHSLLFFILIFEVIIQGIIRRLVIKFFYNNKEYGYYPGIKSTNECIFLFTVLYGSVINFGLPGLYSILLSNKK